MAITLTQTDIDALHRYRDFVQRYYVDFEDRGGITQPMGVDGKPIDGSLCLNTGKDGPILAISAMMHINEPAGLMAQEDIIERWLNGSRPKAGQIILTLGHPPQDVLHFLDNVIEKAEAGEAIDNDYGHYIAQEHLIGLSRALYSETKGKLLDIHSTASADEAMLLPYMPRVKKAQLVKGFDSPDEDGHDPLHNLTYEQCMRVIEEVRYRIKHDDFENDTDRSAANQIIVNFYQAEHDMDETARLLQVGIKHMPVKHIIADYYKSYLASPIGMGMLSSMVQHDHMEGMPTVLETGGPNLASSHHHMAVDCTRAYTHNILGWPEHIKKPNIADRYYYTNAKSMARPAPGDGHHSAMHDESFLILHNADDIPDHVKEKIDDIDWHTIKPGRLNSFVPIQKGDPVAIGMQSGHVIRADGDGYCAITPGGRINPEDANGTGAIFIAAQRTKERDILPELTQSHAR